MNGENRASLKTLGEEVYSISASFALNGASNPLATNSRFPRGFIHTVTQPTAGIHLVVLDPSMNLPALPIYIEANPQFATTAEWFDAAIVGEFNLATRSFQIFTHRSGTAQQPAASAGNRVNWSIFFRNTTSA